MRLILVFCLICQSSLIWCRSVQNEENPGQKLAQLLIPLLDDALDPSEDDASLLEVHPHKDGRRKVELTPLKSKAKKEPKPLAIILTSNLADLKKKKKERKIRKGLVDEVTSDETSDASKEQKTITKKIPARGRLPKIYMNEIRHKPRHISRKNIKVPHYKLKRSKKSHKKIIVEKTEEDTSEEAEKRIKRQYNQLSNDYLRRTVNNVQNSATTEEITFEDDLDVSDSSVVSESTRETNESDNELTSEVTMERTSSDVTESIASDEINEIPMIRKLKHSKVVPKILDEVDVDEGSSHVHKKSEAEVSDEITSEQKTKEKEDNKHKTAEQLSSEISHENSAQSSAGSNDDVTKQITSEEEEDNSKEEHISKLNENSKETHHHDKDVSQEKTEEQNSGHSETKETVSSETKYGTNEITKEEITKEVSSEAKSEERGETSENHSKTVENGLITAEIAQEVTSEVYDIDNSKVTSELSQEEQTSLVHIFQKHDTESQNTSEHETKQVIASQSDKASLKNESDIDDNYYHKTKYESIEVSGETSENQIEHNGNEKSASQEGEHEKHTHSHKHHHVKSIESGVYSSEESTKLSKHENIKEPKTNELSTETSEEAQNSAVTKSVEDEIAENHWVRHRGKPAKKNMKVTKKAKSKKSRRVVESLSAENKKLGTGSWGVVSSSAEHKKPLGTGSWGVESLSAEHKKHLGTGSWGVVSSSAEHKKPLGTGSWGVESLSAEHKKHLGTGSWGVVSSSAEHKKPLGTGSWGVEDCEKQLSTRRNPNTSWGVDSSSVEYNKKHLGTRRSPNSSWSVDDTHSSSKHKVSHGSNKSNGKLDKENHSSSSEHKHSHDLNSKHISGKIEAQINHNFKSEHRHNGDSVSDDQKTIGHSNNSEYHLHASLKPHQEKSRRRRSDQSSSEHDISFRPKCQKKHVNEDIPVKSRRQNNEDEVENDTKNSKNTAKDAKVHKSYNLSFKFDKK